MNIPIDTYSYKIRGQNVTISVLAPHFQLRPMLNQLTPPGPIEREPLHLKSMAAKNSAPLEKPASNRAPSH